MAYRNTLSISTAKHFFKTIPEPEPAQWYGTFEEAVQYMRSNALSRSERLELLDMLGLLGYMGRQEALT